MTIPQMTKGDALIVVDVQRDFCSGGALAIPGGDEVVPVLNAWIAEARRRGAPVFFSRDWHPKDHVSFRTVGGPWPPHCVQDTEGARFHPGLVVPDSARVITKGVRFDKDQNSAFDDTGLAVELRRLGVKRLWVGGLAEDVCVRATVLDGLKEGFEVHLIRAATRPVDTDDGAQARDEMRQQGARFAENRSV
jgi:nicotinamidase/pyrazinamidase